MNDIHHSKIKDWKEIVMYTKKVCHHQSLNINQNQQWTSTSFHLFMYTTSKVALWQYPNGLVRTKFRPVLIRVNFGYTIKKPHTCYFKYTHPMFCFYLKACVFFSRYTYIPHIQSRPQYVTRKQDYLQPQEPLRKARNDWSISLILLLVKYSFISNITLWKLRSKNSRMTCWKCYTVMLSQYGQFFILWYKMRSLWQGKIHL